jgi:hypothetical protein
MCGQGSGRVWETGRRLLHRPEALNARVRGESCACTRRARALARGRRTPVFEMNLVCKTCSKPATSKSGNSNRDSERRASSRWLEVRATGTLRLEWQLFAALTIIKRSRECVLQMTPHHPSSSYASGKRCAISRDRPAAATLTALRTRDDKRSQARPHLQHQKNRDVQWV